MAIIRISGYPGSGKSTLGRQLARKLGYKHLSMGDVFRRMARQKNTSVEQFYAKLASHPDEERKLDEWMIDHLSKRDNIVIDSRMAPFYPTPFKAVNLLLTVDHRESARRLLERPEGKRFSIREMQRRSQKRVAQERAHYRRLYNLTNHLHPKYFDIIIDTSRQKQDAVLHLALRKIKKHFRRSKASR